MILSIMCSTYMVALAEENNIEYEANSTASQLKSKGAIVYQKGTDSVVIDSADLYTLADTLDQFKYSIYSQMAEMNTYLTTEEREINLTTSDNIYVAHSVPGNMVAPTDIEFNTLIEGVAASQSIPNTPLEYGYAADTKLYKTAAGLLTTDESDGKEMIEIGEATAEGISAGKSAWVNGELLLGTGADNQAYYNLGYVDGYAQKLEGLDISYQYHTHKDSKGNVTSANARFDTPSGCFTTSNIVYKTESRQCNGTWVSIGINHDEIMTTIQCNGCGTVSHRSGCLPIGTNCGTHTGYLHYQVDTGQRYYTLGCGKTENSIESATIVYP